MRSPGEVPWGLPGEAKNWEGVPWNGKVSFERGEIVVGSASSQKPAGRRPFPSCPLNGGVSPGSAWPGRAL